MRFVKNGPVIPDFLLDQQEQGNLVFLCGAGISIKAGMPDFVDLTAQIIDELVKSEESTIANEFKPWRNRSSNVPRVPLDALYELILDKLFKMVSNRVSLHPYGNPLVERIKDLLANQMKGANLSVGANQIENANQFETAGMNSIF